MKLHWLFHQFMAPAGEDGGGGGGEDRGDDFTPTEDELDETTTKKPEAKTEDDEPKTDDDKGEPKTDEAKGDGKKDTRIPASRHKEILQKARDEAKAERDRLQAQIDALTAGRVAANVNQKVTEAETKLAGLEEKLEKHRLDGETDKALAVAREIRVLERSIIEQTSEMRLQVATAQAVETVRYSTTLERIEEAYPELNEDHETFDKAKSAEVLELHEAFKAKGMAPSAALQKAVKYVMGAPKTVAEKTAVEVTPRVDPKEVEKERKKAAVDKTATAVGKQPPDISKVGGDHDKAGGSLANITAKDVMKMNQAEFAKLAESDERLMAKLRGDTVSSE